MRVMNVDVDKTVIRTVIRNQIHIKGDNTPETKQQGGKRNAYHNTTTLSVYLKRHFNEKQGILYKLNDIFKENLHLKKMEVSIETRSTSV